MSVKKEVRFYVVFDSRVNKFGMQVVYIRFFQGNRKKDYNTGIKWSPQYFDAINEQFTPRYKEDPDYISHNLKINHIKTLLNKVKIKEYMDDQSLSIEDYISALTQTTPHTNFILYAENEMKHLSRKSIISYKTYRQQVASLNRVRDFVGGDYLPMHKIRLEWIEEFDAYWRGKGRAHNTVVGYHKDIKKYLNRALENRLIKENPYDKFSFKYVDGIREALTQDEVKKLMNLYYQNILEPPTQEALRRFLFSCLCGVRISDTHTLHRKHIKDNFLIFKPHKTSRYGKSLKIPLPAAALKLIENRDELLFDRLSDQFINRALKVVAGIAQINKSLSFHCARDTFGTIFIELGGDIKSLADLMGHSSTRVTAIYLKMSDQRKSTLMNKFDSIFD